jgi:hypothetical protein
MWGTSSPRIGGQRLVPPARPPRGGSHGLMPEFPCQSPGPGIVPRPPPKQPNPVRCSPRLRSCPTRDTPPAPSPVARAAGCQGLEPHQARRRTAKHESGAKQFPRLPAQSRLVAGWAIAPARESEPATRETEGNAMKNPNPSRTLAARLLAAALLLAGAASALADESN